MARLTFRFTPLDSADFDVCAGPARPREPQAEPADKPAEPAEPEAHADPATTER